MQVVRSSADFVLVGTKLQVVVSCDNMQVVRSSADFVLVGTKLQVVVSCDNSRFQDSGLLGCDSVLMNFQRL